MGLAASEPWLIELPWCSHTWRPGSGSGLDGGVGAQGDQLGGLVVRHRGCRLRPQQPPEELKAVVQAVDQAGVPELWLWEDCFLEGGLTAATAALAWSQRLRVGVGLLPVPLAQTRRRP